MRKIFSIPLGADFISELAGIISEDNAIFSDIAVVFAGHRPSLYLSKELLARKKEPFYAPRYFTISEFVDYSVRKKYPFFTDSEPVDAIWSMYRLLHTLPPFNHHPFQKMNFGKFFYWG
ncbi:MAG: hypothetical protein JW827_03585, partial [Spirochaetes bacterium]|nr:hypothetical protein [Spirochaetota bacterium]